MLFLVLALLAFADQVAGCKEERNGDSGNGPPNERWMRVFRFAFLQMAAESDSKAILTAKRLSDSKSFV
jgi:hypothetical protein